MNNSLPIRKSYEFYSPFPIIQPSHYVKEDYSKLTDKLFRSFQHVFLKYENYDWYLKCDDDTYIFMENLKAFLITKNSSNPETYGTDYKKPVYRGYHHGGAGYVLSNAAFKLLGSQLVSNYNFCKNTGIEDKDVANCLRELKIYPKISIDDRGLERFHVFNLKNQFNRDFITETNYYHLDWALYTPKSVNSFVYHFIILYLFSLTLNRDSNVVVKAQFLFIMLNPMKLRNYIFCGETK